MVLADTSVWVDHLRSGDDAMEQVLERDEIVVHPFVIGEIALGHLRQRDLKLETLKQFPEAHVADHDEVLAFINRHNLGGTGIQYVDAHLLVSVSLMTDVKLWTRDKQLHRIAQTLGIAFEEAKQRLQ